ncbi:MAG TPA: 1-acyl-sn-glycerol-3-phosphate acyltransferase [Bacteriovoracaceae bacterium]|nr:1-acyl-sn-glycerol-3-phosphate acyltransferase [Bacteriovoracaceae bacterium]
MSILLQIKAIFITLFLLSFVLTPACLLAWPFPLRYRLKLVGPGWAIFSKYLLKWGCHCRLDVQEDNRSQEFQTNPSKGLYIANHQSFMDIPLMATMFQIPPIMKKEVLYIPVIGFLTWVSGSMPVSRSKGGSRKKVFKMCRDRLIKDQLAVQYYPEGTRSKDGFPRSFDVIKTPLMSLAYNNGIPVIPTSLYGTCEILTDKGNIRTGKHLGIIVHKEVDPKNFESSEEFLQFCWNKVVEGNMKLREQLAHLN